MTINFAGHLYNDAGSAISGASVKLLETGTTTQEGSTVTTDSAGAWAFTEADQDRYDVEITSGSSVRRIRWDDQISLKEIDVRNNSAAGTPAATFSNITNSTANQVAVFSGANSTKADNDEIYLSFKLHDSAGNLDEFARMTVVATDVTSGSEDGQFEFDVLQGGSLIKAFTIASSTAGAQSIDFNQDSVTFGTGTAATDITLTFDAESADGVITWMEDEDYFKFSDEILMNGTEKILFGDTATFIHQSSDGVMTVDGEATIDLNASTAVLVSNDLKLNSDSAVLGFGADNDTTLTHTDGTGLTVNSTNKLTFGDVASFIQQSSDGTLRIDGEAIIDLNASTRVDVSGDIKVGGEVQTAGIGYTDGDNAITIADGGGITVPQAATFSSTISTASGSTIGNLTLANGSITDSGGALDFGNETLTTTGAVDFGAATVDSLSVSDANITNVGDIALDSISADGTDINVAVSDNSATALTIKQGSDAYLIVDTANSSESVSIGTGISGTAITLGHSTSETTVADNLTVTGTVTVGSDGSGTDVIFYSGTAGDNFTWDASAEKLTITGTVGQLGLEVAAGHVLIKDVLYFEDQGGEYISSDGSTLTIAGNIVFSSATVEVSGNLSMSTDDNKIFLGADDDSVISHRGDAVSADAEISNLVVGTSDHPGTAANSMFISNTTTDGDIMFLVSDGGNSKGLLKLNGADGTVELHGNLLPTTDDTYDLGSASAAWQDLFLEGDITFTDSATIKTNGGNLNLHAATGQDVIIGDTDGNYLFVDGGSNHIAFGAHASNNVQFGINFPAETYSPGSAGTSFFRFHVNQNNAVTIDTNDVSLAASVYLEEPNLTVSGVTLATSATLYIAGAASEATNDYALFVDAGTVRFDGYMYFYDQGGEYIFGDGSYLYLIGGSGTMTRNLMPQADDTYDLGHSSYRWDDIYATNGTIQTSDKRDKKDIVATSLGLEFLNKLNPVSYKWATDSKNTSTHYGLIAQEVLETLKECGIESRDEFGGITGDEETRYGARYGEFIAILIKAVQELSEQVKGGST
jgi:hypothetical protein